MGNFQNWCVGLVVILNILIFPAKIGSAHEVAQESTVQNSTQYIPEIVHYPWRTMNRDDLKMIVDPKVEADFRLDQIRNAKKSVRILTFDQRADANVGMPLLKLLGEKARQNVKVSIGTSIISQLTYDPHKVAEKYMNYLAHLYPDYFEYTVVGGNEMWRRDWGWFDGTHIKCLIIDEELVLVTGRGNADEYLSWLDTAITFKGPLVKDSVDAFLRVWERIRIDNSQRRSSSRLESLLFNFFKVLGMKSYFQKYWSGELNLLSVVPGSETDQMNEIHRFWENYPSSTEDLTETYEQKQELNELKNWASRPFQFSSQKSDQVIRGRLLHNQLLNQLYHLPGKPADYSLKDRARLLQDPIVDAILEKMHEFKEIMITTFATIMRPKLKRELVIGKNRGYKIQILSNSSNAHKNMIRGVLPFAPLALGWNAGLPDLDDVLSGEAETTHNQCAAYVFTAKQGCPLVYSHRKFVVAGDSVFLGSDNLTKAGFVQDEITFQFQGDSISEWGRQEFENSVREHAEKLDPEQIHCERQSYQSNALRWACGQVADFIY